MLDSLWERAGVRVAGTLRHHADQAPLALARPAWPARLARPDYRRAGGAGAAAGIPVPGAGLHHRRQRELLLAGLSARPRDRLRPRPTADAGVTALHRPGGDPDWRGPGRVGAGAAPARRGHLPGGGGTRHPVLGTLDGAAGRAAG